MSKLGKWALALGFCALLAGCASVTVNTGTELAVPQMPKQILVAGFDINSGEWKVDREDYTLTEFKQNLQNMLASGVAADIAAKLKIPTSRVASARNLPSQNAWLVTGQFVRVYQGSRLLRATVGFGAGGTKVETVVRVYDLQNGYSQTPFLTFTTDGGSGAMPGGLESLSPLGAALKATAGVAKGLTGDTQRTARMITAEISQYMYQSGWLPASLYIKPKQD